jgi:hypothetical protein
MGRRAVAWVGIVTVLAALMVAIEPAIGGPPGLKQAKPFVHCSFDQGAGVLTIKLRSIDALRLVPQRFRDEFREEFGELELPGTASVQRRGDSLTVLSALVGEDPFAPFYGGGVGVLFDAFTELLSPGGGGPVPCRGGPTVLDTSLIKVRLAKKSSTAAFAVDNTYGALTPGTAGSAVPVDVEVRGTVDTRLTRGADTVEVAGTATSNFVGTDRGAVFEPELTTDESLLSVDGAGAGDTITIRGRPVATQVPLGLFISGGQGDDTITGGGGSETFIGGPGADRIRAGVGQDFVLVYGHGTDTIDCGPGHDVVVVKDARAHMHACDEEVTFREFLRLLDQLVSVEPSRVEARLRALVPSRIWR